MDRNPPKERPAPIGNFQLVTVKISQFEPEIETSPLLKHRYSVQEKLYRRRQMVQTPISQYHSEQRPATTDQRRGSLSGLSLSKFMENEISRLRESGARLSQFSPLLKQKMSELRSIMELKRAALRVSPMPKGNVNFSEYKMTGLNPPDDLSILHSRQRQESPFMKSAKVNKEKFASIEVDPTSKYAPAKKMVLLGGGLRRNAATANPEIKSQQPRMSHTSARNRNYILRRTVRHRKQKMLANQLDDENGQDCKPWDTQKEEEQQGL